MTVAFDTDVKEYQTTSYDFISVLYAILSAGGSRISKAIRILCNFYRLKINIFIVIVGKFCHTAEVEAVCIVIRVLLITDSVKI